MKRILLIIACAMSLNAIDYTAAFNSVDKQKAGESVKTEEALKAYNKGANVTLDDVTKSVDVEKAKDSVDTEKLTKSLFN
jgi:hypothetical protein